MHIHQTNFPTLILGMGGILFLYLASKKIPQTSQHSVSGFRINSTGYCSQFNISGSGRGRHIPQGLPSLIIPDPALLDVNILVTLAATVFLISFMEGYLFATEYAAKNRYKIDKNQELLALGMSNIAVGIFQGLPVAGSLSRTAVNDESGAKSQLASIVSGLVIMLVLVFFTGIFTNLPQPYWRQLYSL